MKSSLQNRRLTTEKPAMGIFLPSSVTTISRTLILDPPMTDMELEKTCRDNELVWFERGRDGTIYMSPLPGLGISSMNAAVNGELGNWAMCRPKALTLMNAGFFLRDGSMLGAKSAYIDPATRKGFSKAELTGFPRLCPDFVIELLPASDKLPQFKQKMECWIENGAKLGWLVDPYTHLVRVYEPGKEAIAVAGSSVAGTGPVERIVLDLEEVWHCYEM
jgi:Uma2 family endonuclease